jgi:biopolymer transport protein ExbB/TolQ
MLFRKNPSSTSLFHVSLGPAVVAGTGACVLLYGSMLVGPLHWPALRRYCSSHPMAMATIEVFMIAVALLINKLSTVIQQARAFRQASMALEEIGIAQSESSDSVPAQDKPQWLHTLWQTQSPTVGNSWLGHRINAILHRQNIRPSSIRLDQDLTELSQSDSAQQRQQSRWIRGLLWTVPILGLLGTLMCVSGTLVNSDSQAISSGSREAIQSLTSSLYVACNLTVVGIVLALAGLALYLVVNGLEQNLLAAVDQKAFESIHAFLSEPQPIQPTDAIRQVILNSDKPMEISLEPLLASVQQLVQKQSVLWQETISAAHEHWQDLHSKSADTLQIALTHAIETAIAKQENTISAHSENIARIQAESIALIDSRWQQWQTTLSEQARAVHHQQRDMYLQTELLNKLIEKHDAIRDMESPLQATLERLTDIDRFHEAAICLTEAVAVLGTQMERYGYLGRQPLRRRAVEEDDTSVDEPVTYKMQRRAG